MNWIADIVGSPGFQHIACVGLGTAVIVRLALWYERLHIRRRRKYRSEPGEAPNQPAIGISPEDA
jgi:hypothetical protein